MSVYVRQEDQTRINEFGRNQRVLDEAKLALEAVKKDAEALEDAEVEAATCDSDARLLGVGSSYFHVGEDFFDQVIEARSELVAEKLSKASGEVAVLTSRQNELKNVLYARFGDNINLEA